jgi:hypothetical protein
LSAQNDVGYRVNALSDHFSNLVAPIWTLLHFVSLLSSKINRLNILGLQSIDQGTLTEGEGPIQLTSMY